MHKQFGSSNRHCTVVSIDEIEIIEDNKNKVQLKTGGNILPMVVSVVHFVPSVDT